MALSAPSSSPETQQSPPGGSRSPATAATANQRSTGLIALIAAGLLLRVALAVVSWGANDANLFGEFGFYITRDGLMPTYRSDPRLNHPPIPAYWCAVTWRLTVQFISDGDRLYSDQNNWNTPGRWFSAVFKIPVILADFATAWLLFRLWRERQGVRRGLAVAAMYAWCLDAILVSGYHCNTDPIYAFFCLLSVYLAGGSSTGSWRGPSRSSGQRRHTEILNITQDGPQLRNDPLHPPGGIVAKGRIILHNHHPPPPVIDRPPQRHFWAGLALAAAINVKLTPLLLVPPLLMTYRDWRQAARFLAGVAAGVIPFLPVLYFAGHSFYGDGIAYKSNLDRWGIPYLLMLHGRGADVYHEKGRLLVLALIGLWAVAARLAGRRDRCEAATVTLAIFLFFAPGFGVQYTVMVVPLMFAARPALANLYGLLAGLFLLVVYWGHWTGRWPPDSQFHGYFPWPSALWGLAAWGALGLYLLRAVFLPSAIRWRSHVRRGSSAPGGAADRGGAIAPAGEPIEERL